MSRFEEAFAIAEMREQEKATQKKAKKAYIADLVAQGVDKAMAKIMADAFFASGMLKAI